MFPPPKDQIDITAPEFETTPLVKPQAFANMMRAGCFPRNQPDGHSGAGLRVGNVLHELLDTGKTPPLWSGMIIALIRNLISSRSSTG